MFRLFPTNFHAPTDNRRALGLLNIREHFSAKKMRAAKMPFTKRSEFFVGKPGKITVRGRVDEVIDEMIIGRKRFLVLERLGRKDIFRVFDPSAGFQGDYRVVHLMPRSREVEQQVEILRRLADKNLHFPKILDCSRQNDKIAVVTTWIWGNNLRQFLTEIRERKHPRPSTREIVRLINKLAHGLSYLHVKANVVHGDVKPANIVLEKDPTRLVLIDFGSAWPAERSRKKSPGDGVSAPYAAPELFGEGSVDFRADIFSLSVVLYELLTLEIPFDGAGGQAGLPENRAAFSGKYRPPSELLPDAHLLPGGVTRALDEFLRRGLALDPKERFSNKSDWLNAADQLLSDFREGTRLGFFGRAFLDLLDRFTGRKK